MRIRPGQLVAVLAAILVVAPLVAGCGSGSGSGSSSGSGQAIAAVSAACTQVADALADGPDPDADPVGYAEAQIRPLREIATADQALHTALAGLASAYAQVYGTHNSAPARAAVTTASREVDAICPGAAA
jgi:hypothetical protein